MLHRYPAAVLLFEQQGHELQYTLVLDQTRRRFPEKADMPNILVVCTGPSPLRLLFLCTGNYYRSRFAEILFNALATSTGLNWVAVSRGLATDRVSGKVGPISAYVVKGLEARGIALDLARSPEQVQEGDLRSAELVIALN